MTHPPPPAPGAGKGGVYGTAALLSGLLSPVMSLLLFILYAMAGGDCTDGVTPGVFLALVPPTLLTVWLGFKVYLAGGASRIDGAVGMGRAALGAFVSLLSTIGLLRLAAEVLHPTVSNGRPLRVRGRRHTAPLRRGRAWARPPAAGGPPEAEVLAGLDSGERAWLAAAWQRDAAEEHAAVAAFARLSLDLLAAGAPPGLLAGAHQAALDEVGHAEACFRLAGRYCGQPCAPAPLPVASARAERSEDRDGLLGRLAAESLTDGCLSEGVAAAMAARAQEGAGPAALRALLACIASEEQRHAELGWQVLAWCLQEGGEPVRARVAAALASLPVRSVVRDAEVGAPALLRWHGRLDGEEQRAAYKRVREQVVAAAQALLDRTGTEAAAA